MSWDRKYRPHALSDVALAPDLRRTFEQFLASRDMPDLLITGPPGRGKTTLASILEGELSYMTAVFNASGTRGIDLVRDSVSAAIAESSSAGGLARLLSTNPNAPFRILRFEEAEGMTSDALRAMRTVMQERPEWVRFIFTGNLPPRDAAVCDRLHPVEVDDIPVAEKARVLEAVMAAEGVAAELNVLQQCALQFASMRQLLRYAERSFAELGFLQPPTNIATTADDRDSDLFLLLSVHRIVVATGRDRLRSRDVLRALATEGFDGGALTYAALAKRLGRFGVRSRDFTDPGKKTAKGYFAADLDAAIARRASIG